jgi:hypothetical protein
MQLKGRRYVTQESVIRWHAARADKLTFYLLGFSLHVELLDSSESYVTDVANYAIHPVLMPGSSVDIATGYGMDGPGIESRLGRDFPHLSRPALGPTQPPVQ